MNAITHSFRSKINVKKNNTPIARPFIWICDLSITILKEKYSKLTLIENNGK